MKASCGAAPRRIATSSLRAAVAAAVMGGFAAAAAPQDAQPDAAAKSAAGKPLHGAGKGETAKAEHAAKPDAAKPELGKADTAKTEPGKADTPPPEPPPPPYEPQVLRLAEILGALAWLDDLCGAKSDWRARMQQFLEAEAKTPERKERFAGSFNRSFHDYEQSYQTCTPNAQIVIGRFLNEGGRIARDVANRFSAS